MLQSNALGADSIAGDRDEPILEVTGLQRRFDETTALASASLRVRRGEIHALLGENGSGKSTLVKILSGVLRPNAGHVHWEGQLISLRSPRRAQRVGIATVFQETLVVEELSVLDNLFLGMDGLLRKESTRVEEERRAVEVFDELGFRGFDLGRPVWTLSLADKQIVTVVRALVRPWRLLILDESTSALDREVRDRLFGLLARSIASGDRAIVFTTHRLDEVEQFADSATVLRAGATAGILSREELSRGRILELMSSRQLSTRAAEKETSSQVLPPTRWVGDVADVLRAEDLVLRPGGRRFSLSLHTGEIFGVTGLEGQGQVRLLECTAGLQKPFAGQVLVTRDGELTHVRGYRDAYRKGVVYVPRDRKQEGLFLVQSVFNNLALPVLGRFSKAGLIRRQQVVEWLTTYTKQLSLDTARLNSPVGSLSGGNQQKVLLGRWMAVNPVVFVLNDPLRGVDEVTKQELYEVFRALALQGLTILFLSTEISELLTLCERVAVFWDSGLEAVITGAELTEQSIIDAMFGRGPATEAERA